MIRIVCFFLVVCCSLYSDPWGKDADLTSKKQYCYQPRKAGPIAEAMIGFHQKVVSPAQGPRSHFKPSSSQYTLEAMRKYGFFRGYLMGCDRLMRENDEKWVYRTLPWTDLKYDPVR